MKKPFVLSGGGARGFAHLGVIKALHEQKVYPSEISGTSAGAIAGAFLANGYTVDEVIEILAGKLSRRMFTWNSLRMGLISFNKVSEYIKKNLRHHKFEELNMPLYITATSFIDGTQKIFNKGDIMEALAASCAIPAIFPAVEIDNIPYVDGGLFNNLPVEPFLNRKKDVVCVHVNPIRDLSEKRGLWEIIDRSFHLSFVEKVRRSAHGCFMYIEPKELIDYNLFELSKANEIIDIGYNYGVKYLLEHPNLIKEASFLEKLKTNLSQLVKQ
ncbi:patatin-like phospholipase family protein [Albibacterium bauzanense]|uniref:NTE family protein n=1 Tax=Albibacterium bauzanense TaxID=653929 RepID=A0A4R1M383_9SPHI|nr:patatin-like phospholipase family protein [Albibacterium bauzanense]TCK85692.1 NTE family protein [Albibacterium bauzanense]